MYRVSISLEIHRARLEEKRTLFQFVGLGVAAWTWRSRGEAPFSLTFCFVWFYVPKLINY